MKIANPRGAWITTGILAYILFYILALVLDSGILVACLFAPLVLAVVACYTYLLYCIIQKALDTSDSWD
jgi:hypothetical protein